MSEQTTETSGSHVSSDEPSMEDILSSIRKLIAEDDAPPPVDVGINALLPDEKAEQGADDLGAILQEMNLTAESVPASVESDHGEALAGSKADTPPQADLVDAELDALLADLSGEADDIGDNGEILDLEIPMMSAEAEPDEIVSKPVEPEESPDKPGEDDDLSSLLGDLLEPEAREAEPGEPEVVDTIPESSEDVPSVVSKEQPVADTVTTEPNPPSDAEDMELVKSLIADLIDEPDGDEIPDASIRQTEPVLEPEGEDDSQSAVIDELIAEMSAGEDALQGAEDHEKEPVTPVAPAAEDDSENLLLAIAAEAEADAEAATQSFSQEPVELAPVTKVGGIRAETTVIAEQPDVSGDDVENALLALETLIGDDTAEAMTTVDAPHSEPGREGPTTEDILNELSADLMADEPQESSEDHIREQLPEVELPAPEIHQQDLPEQDLPEETSEMASKAAKSDTILDDVTESATASAFASLNQAVEEKAVLSESGPRIGELVQDALRPMLKEWLDANLKGIVERAVAKEVKRISSSK